MMKPMLDQVEKRASKIILRLKTISVIQKRMRKQNEALQRH
jgi:hypothetical protein